VRLGSSGRQAILEVIDHGNGLAADERAHMTERFARGDEARSTPGSGLGLALVKAIMHAHGGELELDDTPGGGLTARLKLPLASLA
jgi:two-component system sensor histidine kinase TctE